MKQNPENGVGQYQFWQSKIYIYIYIYIHIRTKLQEVVYLCYQNCTANLEYKFKYGAFWSKQEARFTAETIVGGNLPFALFVVINIWILGRQNMPSIFVPCIWHTPTLLSLKTLKSTYTLYVHVFIQNHKKVKRNKQNYGNWLFVNTDNRLQKNNNAAALLSLAPLCSRPLSCYYWPSRVGEFLMSSSPFLWNTL